MVVGMVPYYICTEYRNDAVVVYYSYIIHKKSTDFTSDLDAMDRETIRNMFFPNNSTSTNNALGNDIASAQTQQSSDAARALEIAGYPTLLQEYLLQQQQQEQQRLTSMNTGTASDFASNALGLASSGFLQQQNYHMYAGGRLGAGTDGTTYNNPLFLVGGVMDFGGGLGFSNLGTLQQLQQQQQMVDTNQLLLQRLRTLSGPVVSAGLPVGVGGDPSGLKTNDLANQFATKGMLGPWSEHSAGLLGSMVEGASDEKAGKTKKGRKKQPKDKDRPKRPLSAYNLCK
jgi:hypothetical protein